MDFRKPRTPKYIPFTEYFAKNANQPTVRVSSREDVVRKEKAFVYNPNNTLQDANATLHSLKRAIFTVTMSSTQILVVNFAACKLLNYNSEELCNMRLLNLVEDRHRHKLKRIRDLLLNDSDQALIKVEKLVEFVSKDGDIIPASIFFKRMEPPQRCLAVVEPIDRRISVLTMDGDGVIVTCDNEATKIFEYDLTELIGLHITDLVPGAILSRNNTATYEISYKLRLTGKTKGGNYFPLCLLLKNNIAVPGCWQLVIWVFLSLSGLIILNRELRISNCNYQIMKLLFGATRDKVLNQKITNFIPGFPEDINPLSRRISNQPDNSDPSSGSGSKSPKTLMRIYRAERNNLKKQDSHSCNDVFHISSGNHKRCKEKSFGNYRRSLKKCSCKRKHSSVESNLNARLSKSDHELYSAADSNCFSTDDKSVSGEEIDCDKNRNKKELDSGEVIPIGKQKNRRRYMNYKRLRVKEGYYSGYGKHWDGNEINIYYKVKVITFGDKLFYCVWISRDPWEINVCPNMPASVTESSSFVSTPTDDDDDDDDDDEDEDDDDDEEDDDEDEDDEDDEDEDDDDEDEDEDDDEDDEDEDEDDEDNDEEEEEDDDNDEEEEDDNDDEDEDDNDDDEEEDDVKPKDDDDDDDDKDKDDDDDKDKDNDKDNDKDDNDNDNDNTHRDSNVTEELTRDSSMSVISQNDDLLTKGEYSKNYTNIQQIGKGAFGYVKMAYRHKDGLLVVTKFIKKRKINVQSWVFDPKWNMKIPLEISLLVNLKHPNIVEVLDVFYNDSFFQLVMKKHGAGMDLFEFIERKPNSDEQLNSYIFRQLVSAVMYLDSIGVLHRDIKDENVIINEKFQVKLIDFGSATFKSPDKMFSVFYGTVEYCSPEVLQGNKYRGPELEVWALGVTLYVLSFGENPFYDVQETIKGRFSVSIPISPLLFDLLHKMLDKDIDLRITIARVAVHPWIIQPVDIDKYKFEDVVHCSAAEANPPRYKREFKLDKNPDQRLDSSGDRTVTSDFGGDTLTDKSTLKSSTPVSLSSTTSRGAVTKSGISLNKVFERCHYKDMNKKRFSLDLNALKRLSSTSTSSKYSGSTSSSQQGSSRKHLGGRMEMGLVSNLDEMKLVPKRRGTKSHLFGSALSRGRGNSQKSGDDSKEKSSSHETEDTNLSTNAEVCDTSDSKSSDVKNSKSFWDVKNKKRGKK